jgi:hypothetical protein
MTDKFVVTRVKELDTPEYLAIKARLKARRQQQFVKVPLIWIDRLQTTRRVATWVVAVRLLREHWRNNGHQIRLGNVALKEAGVNRASKWRALGELERWGLIVVERRHRKSPLVKVRAT